MKIKVLFVNLLIFGVIFQIKSEPLTIDHQIWNKLLKSNVSESGRVDYQGFINNQEQFYSYLNLLSKNEPSASWSKNEKMAFWINAYNAFTIKLIIENRPLKSIMEINKGQAWDIKFIKIGEKTLSLNNIEHDILRAKYSDARIHFAVNCASISCPRLYNSAFTASDLESQLNKLTKSFINNSEFNLITKNSIKISKIFEWYQEDFTKGESLIDFLNRYTTINISSTADITFIDYNWNLNN
ncbi:MAG: DUF547 domain-containing protein [Flavobacteriales bacterium]|nr:DUF547 domain-containing protein [Flavobacteriales bacterium]